MRRRIECPQIDANGYLIVSLYANDVVIFSYDVESMQHLLGVLKEIFHSTSSECDENKNDGSANHPTSSLPNAHI